MRFDLNPVAQIPARTCLGAVLGDFSSGGLLISDRSHDPAKTLAMHEHSDAYLSIVLGGGYLETAGAVIECTRGSIVAHPAGHAHANRFGQLHTRCVIVHADSDWLGCRPLKRLIDDYRHIRLDTRIAAVRRLELELETRDTVAALGVASAMLELIAIAVREEDRRGAPRWIATVIDAIEADLPTTPSLTDLAAIAGIHPSHLARAFRRARGETVGTYIRRRRLEEADRALCNDHLTIAEVALGAGFCDQAHFTRAYRRHFGRTPGRRIA